jgi:hypothetical protein
MTFGTETSLSLHNDYFTLRNLASSFAAPSEFSVGKLNLATLTKSLKIPSLQSLTIAVVAA